MAGTIRVLQVDDEPDFLEMSAELLERTSDGIEVVTETDGEAALDRLAGGGVDCVVSDYDMPGTDGLGLLREVRTSYPDTPFILLTARGSEAVASEAISAGVDDYLQKGGGEEQYQLLANRVRNLVRQARAETSYQEIFDNATVGLTVRDKDTGELVDANDRYCELLGYSKAELPDLELEDITATELGYTRERALSKVRDLDEDEVETFEWLDRTSDGELLWVEVSLRRATIEGEERVLASVRDITERKTNERDLAQTREYYETVAANLPNAAVGIYDRELTYEFVDGGIFDGIDLDAAEMTGALIPEFHSEAFVEDHLDHFEAALEGEPRTFEFRFEDRTYQGYTLPVIDEESEVIAGMVLGRDVTEVREREHRLEKLASLLSRELHPPISAASEAVDLAVEEGDTDELADARVALDRIESIADDALAIAGVDGDPDT